MTVMRAKMILSEVGTMRNIDGDIACETLKFNAVCKSDGYPADGSDEDNSFAKWTPTANISMSVTNPDLFGKLVPGAKYYVDFTAADA